MVFTQVLSYKKALAQAEMDYVLYIAVSYDAFEKITELNFLQSLIEEFQLKFMVVDIEEKIIDKWIN